MTYENDEIATHFENRDIFIGNFKVNFTTFKGELDEIDDISAVDSLLTCDLYVKNGEEFITLKEYIENELVKGF